MPGLIDTHVHVLMSASSQASAGPEGGAEAAAGAGHGGGWPDAAAGFHQRSRPGGGPMLVDRPAIDRGSLPGPRLYPSGAMISQTSGHGDSRLPHERSRRFFGDVSRGEMLGANFIADGRDEVLTATRENFRASASQIKVMAGGGAASAYDPLDVTQ